MLFFLGKIFDWQAQGGPEAVILCQKGELFSHIGKSAPCLSCLSVLDVRATSTHRLYKTEGFVQTLFQCWTQDWPKYLVIPVWWPWQTEVSLQIKCLSSKIIIVGCPTYSVEGPWDQGVQSFQYSLLGLWPLWQLVHILIFRKRSHQSIINISMTSSTTEKDLRHQQKVWISNQTLKKSKFLSKKQRAHGNACIVLLLIKSNRIKSHYSSVAR